MPAARGCQRPLREGCNPGTGRAGRVAVVGNGGLNRVEILEWGPLGERIEALAQRVAELREFL